MWITLVGTSLSSHMATPCHGRETGTGFAKQRLSLLYTDRSHPRDSFQQQSPCLPLWLPQPSAGTVCRAKCHSPLVSSVCILPARPSAS